MKNCCGFHQKCAEAQAGPRATALVGKPSPETMLTSIRQAESSSLGTALGPAGSHADAPSLRLGVRPTRIQ